MLVYSLLALLVIWLISVTFIIFRTRQHYNRLTSTTGAQTLDKALDRLLEHDDIFKKDISKIQDAIANIEKRSISYYQKIGFVRFNPFKRVGGKQSFILALLDEEDNGILLNFLYSREGMRIYAKPVKRGKADEHELSDEEKEAIAKAA